MVTHSPSSTLENNLDVHRNRLVELLEGESIDLPLLPVVAHQVLLLSDDPNADATKLSTLIQQDQALAGQILRIANSPAYLPRSPIVSLQQAIAWLGMNMLAGLAFSVSVQSGVFQVKGFEREVQGLWRHALATGLYGKEIARRMRQNVENAFLCGMLHTIGKPVAIHLLLSNKDAFPVLPWESLESLVNDVHILAGTKLAERWQLPQPVQETIRYYLDEAYHHARSPTKGAVITCLAHHLASWTLDSAVLSEESIRELPVVHDLNFYPEDMASLIELQDTIKKSVESFIV